jgi:hypothetical protein
LNEIPEIAIYEDVDYSIPISLGSMSSTSIGFESG